MKKLCLLFFIATFTSIMAQQKQILLFPNGAPGETSKMIEVEDLSGNKTAGCPVSRI